MVREGLKPFLERIGSDVEVIEAGTLADVLRLLDGGRRFDLVVLDLKMPGMDGFQGLRRVREDHPDLPVVILSSVADREQVLEIMSIGAAGFIPKSLSGVAMTSALRLVMSGERFIPAMLLNHTEEAPHTEPGLNRLTPREREVLELLREGLPNKIIARRLNLSEVTVKSHLFSVFRKLGVSNRVQAVRRLVELAET